MKKIIIAVGLVLAILTTITIASAYPASPSYPASNYIKTIYPWEKDDGVSLLLTQNGWTQGATLGGAYKIAGYTIYEYNRLEGQDSWPYNKRSQWSIMAEIYFHCKAINPTKETIDMGFNEWGWS